MKGLKYAYPTYGIEITPAMLQEGQEIAFRLLSEVGIRLRHEKFRNSLKGKEGVCINGDRICFDRKLTQRKLEKALARKKEQLLAQTKTSVCGADKWQVSTGGFSMMVIDPQTDQLRLATCQDLRDLIKVMDSYGIGGSYPVMPQDLPAIMQAVACFKICWETSDKVRPYDYQNIKQTDYIYEMHQVIGKTFTITLNVTQTMTLSEEDTDIFLKFYPKWKAGADINYQICDYPMLGVSKPISATGCVTQYLAESLGVYTLFNLFDPDLEMPFNVQAGRPVDLRSICWAFGHPRWHLFEFLNERLPFALCDLESEKYICNSILLASNSCSVDSQAALEKMACGLVAALQGCRSFSYAGSLAVDDLFSGVQLVIDTEIFNYIREVVESFNPSPDLVSMDGLYQLLKEVSLDQDQFISHPDTAAKFRNIIPVSNLIYREKAKEWLKHKKTLKERASEEYFRRLSEHKQTFHLPPEKQKAMDDIYRRAEAHLI